MARHHLTRLICSLGAQFTLGANQADQNRGEGLDMNQAAIDYRELFADHESWDYFGPEMARERYFDHRDPIGPFPHREPTKAELEAADEREAREEAYAENAWLRHAETGRPDTWADEDRAREINALGYGPPPGF